jgi:RNA 3'-terminal phosphate cyclase (ATP)
VTAEAYREIGIKFSIDVLKRGYYPKGGGIVRTTIEPCPMPNSVELLNTHSIIPKIISVCSRLPKHVSERQALSALIVLEKNGLNCRNYAASLDTSISPGSSILVYSVSNFGPFIGGDSIGELGKRAESVGGDAAKRFLENIFTPSSIDPFLADMLVLPLALSKGKSRYRVARVTMHLQTNLQVASWITNCKYNIEYDSDTCTFIITIGN